MTICFIIISFIIIIIIISFIIIFIPLKAMNLVIEYLCTFLYSNKNRYLKSFSLLYKMLRQFLQHISSMLCIF